MLKMRFQITAKSVLMRLQGLRPGRVTCPPFATPLNIIMIM